MSFADTGAACDQRRIGGILEGTEMPGCPFRATINDAPERTRVTPEKRPSAASLYGVM